MNIRDWCGCGLARRKHAAAPSVAEGVHCGLRTFSRGFIASQGWRSHPFSVEGPEGEPIGAFDELMW